MSDSRSIWARVRSEPLVGFLAIGVLLFVIDRARAAPEDDARRIVIDAPFVEGLRTEAARRTGHEPDQAETDALVSAYVREEALYREARALGLDVGDVIVRRRLVQKIELLLAAEETPDEPSDAELAAYLAAHADRWAAPARTSVTLCFFSRELHADAAADAARSLADRAAGGETTCDPHLTGDTFRERTDAQLAAILGDEAPAALAGAEIGAWAGPLETARGLYLVRVDARTPGGPAELDAVRDDVRDAMIEERRDAALHDREDEITRAYEVVRL